MGWRLVVNVFYFHFYAVIIGKAKLVCVNNLLMNVYSCDRHASQPDGQCYFLSARLVERC